MNIWITTDTHFSHEKLIEFGRPKDFETQIQQKLLKAVNPGDLLIHLGDVCMGHDETNNEWFNQLECKKYLIKGNHDNKSLTWYLQHGWDSVSERLDIKHFGKRIAFTHQPIAWDGYFDFNIHGHFHDTDGRRQPDYREDIMSGYNKLIALEYTDYEPVNLRKFLNQ